MYCIEHYLTANGHNDPYASWLSRLKDSRMKVSVIRRVARLEQGNFGDHKFCKDGVWELRLDVGPGVRIYYALAGKRVVLLLGGGDKGSQATDIQTAVNNWNDWQRRTDDEKQAP